VEVDTGKGTEESWAKVYDRLEKDVKWTDIIGEMAQDREWNSPQTGLDQSSRGSRSQCG
jgi:hypothetical protein